MYFIPEPEPLTLMNSLFQPYVSMIVWTYIAMSLISIGKNIFLNRYEVPHSLQTSVYSRFIIANRIGATGTALMSIVSSKIFCAHFDTVFAEGLSSNLIASLLVITSLPITLFCLLFYFYFSCKVIFSTKSYILKKSQDT